MVGRLAETIFQTRSIDDLITQDPYKVSDSTPRNTIYDSARGIYGDAIKTLRTDKNSLANLTRLMGDYKRGYVDKADMFTQALGMMGTSLPGLLGGMAGNLKKKMETFAGKEITDAASKAYTILSKGAQIVINSTDYDGTYNITQMANELLGDADLLEFINIEAESSIIGAIASEAIAYGIPGIVTEIIEMNNSDEVQWNSWSYVSYASIEYSNIYYLNQSINVIGAPGVLAQTPDAVVMIPANYKMPEGLKPSQYLAELTELVNTIKRIDPYWDKEVRNGVYVPSLKPYINATPDAHTLFMQRDPERLMSMASRGMTTKTCREVIVDLYPNALVS